MKYSIHTTRQYRRRVWLITSVFFATLVIVFGLYMLLAHANKSTGLPPTLQRQSARQTSKTLGADIQSRLLFVGDVMWGRLVQRHAEQSGKGYAYLTSGLTRDDRNQYDAWIANFECPITTKDVPYELQVSILKFNCRPEYLPNLAKWFTAVSQANNHTMNVDGQWGIEQGRKHLDAAGIQYFGNYDMTKLNDICEVISMPAHVAQTGKKVTMPIALCGYMQVVNVAPSDEQLAVMHRYSKVMPVIAMPHMGVEYRSTAEPEKNNAYRRMIDAGADAVIAAHPHVVQNSEVYKGRLIAYSLGNFLFDQQSVGPESTRGLGVGITLKVSDAQAAALYRKIAPSCQKFHDTCLTSLTAQLPKRPKISVSYTFSCYDESRAVGSVPHLATQQVCDVIKREGTIDRLKNLSREW